MNMKTVAGVVLILAGALFLSNLVSLTVIADDLSTIKVNSIYPDGTSDTPLEIVAGSMISFRVDVTFAGVSLPSNWDAYVNLNGERIDLQCTYQDYSMIYLPEMSRKVLIGEGTFEAEHAAPEAPGVYEIQWVLDSGTLVDRFSTFVKIPDAGGGTGDDGEIERIPEGYFVVEGVDTRNTQEYTTSDPALDLVFVPTNNADVISDVYVEITRKMDSTWTDEIHLQKQTSGRYTGTYELTIGDEYTIRGYVVYGEQTDMKMSFTMTFVPPQDQAPKGFFTINGIELKDGMVLYVNDSELEIRFYCTENVQNLEGIFVEISKINEDAVVTKRVDASEREITYRLPGDGIYTITGYIEWDEGAIQVVSCSLAYEGEDTGIGIGTAQLVGAVMMVAGIGLVISGRRP